MSKNQFVFFASTLLLILGASGSSRADAAGLAVPTTQPAEAWSMLPPRQWPQLVLTNDASFDGHTPLHGASAFLVRMPDDEILVGTAKHLIKKAGGVDPPLLLADLDGALASWHVFPRTKPGLVIDAKKLALTANHESAHDWLLLHLVEPHGKLPATPLTPRLAPAQVGETVYLVGVPYSDKVSAQNIYKGTVTARPFKNYFTFEFDPPVHIAGFSGAPIVDANGLLLGHGVSMSPQLKQKDGLEIEFGAEDASLAVRLWQHRDDPPAAVPATALHLDLPEGWIPKTSKLSNVLKLAEYRELLAFFELVGEPKADFDENVDLMAWAKLVKGNSTKASKLAKREETDLKAAKTGGRPTVEYEITGEIKGIEFRWRIIMLELNGCYCKVACWTTPKNWDAAQSKFEEIVARMK